MSALADALRELASLTRSGRSVRDALFSWPGVTDDRRLHEVTLRTARRAALGADIQTTLMPLASLGADGAMVIAAISSHVTHGGSLAASLGAVADAIDERERLVHEGRAASAAARLSTRLLITLAIGSVVIVSVFDRGPVMTVAISMCAASLLAGCGFMWMKHLQPKVPVGDDPAASAADLTAALVSGGMRLSDALEVTTVAAADGSLVGVRRRVRLGEGWPAALRATGERSWSELGDSIALALETGAPVQNTLRRLSSELRERRRREGALAARRAPVLLVLPLTLCFLPAFGIAMVVPLLRAATG